MLEHWVTCGHDYREMESYGRLVIKSSDDQPWGLLAGFPEEFVCNEHRCAIVVKDDVVARRWVFCHGEAELEVDAFDLGDRQFRDGLRHRIQEWTEEVHRYEAMPRQRSRV